STSIASPARELSKDFAWNWAKSGEVFSAGIALLAVGMGARHKKWKRWRDVGQAGSLRGGWLPPPSGANAASGRLTIGRSLPSCPTKPPAALRTHTLGFKPFCLVRAVFHFAGDQEGQLHRLFVVEAGVYLAFVGAGEVGFTRAAGAANTLGH